MNWCTAALLAAHAALAQDGGASKLLTLAPDRRIELDFQHYYAPKDLGAALGALAQAYPEYLKLESLGKSAGENEVWVVSVGDTRVGELAARPAMAWIGGLAEGDFAGSEMCLYSIYDLVQNHERDAKAAEILSSVALYVVPCVDPDRRSRAFSADAAQKGPAPRAVELDRNFPSAWDPWIDRAGPYPLSEPESRALVEFLEARGNVDLVLSTASGALATFERDDLPADDRATYRRVAQSIGAARGGVSPSGAHERRLARGAFSEFALQELGAFDFEARVATAEGLPPTGELYELGRQFARLSSQLASFLPRYQLSDASLTRLKTDLWQVEVALRNVGDLPGSSVLGRSHGVVDSLALSVGGGRLIALATRRATDTEFAADPHPIDRPTIDALDGGEQIRLRLIVQSSADSSLEISVLGRRGGSAKASIALK